MHQIVQESITRTDLDLRKALYHNIVLSGGSTLCKNFPDRLMREIKRLAVEDMKIRISAPAERKYTTWIGGSILAGLSTFRKVCELKTSLINSCLFVLLDVGKRGRVARGSGNHLQAIRLEQVQSIDGALHKFVVLPQKRRLSFSYKSPARNPQISPTPSEKGRRHHFPKNDLLCKSLSFQGKQYTAQTWGTLQSCDF